MLHQVGLSFDLNEMKFVINLRDAQDVEVCHWQVKNFYTPCTLEKAKDENIIDSYNCFSRLADDCALNKGSEFAALENKMPQKISGFKDDEVNGKFITIHNDNLYCRLL